MKNFLIGLASGILISIVFFLFMGFIFAQFLFPDSDRLNAPVIYLQKDSLPASYNLQLKDLRTGKMLDSNDLKNKVLLLNFWERWCAPCRKELPSIEKLYAIAGDSSIRFCIVSTQNEPATRRENIIHNYAVPFYHLKSVMPECYRGERIPRTYLISKSGRIVMVYNAAAEWDREEVVSLIDSLKRAN